MKKLNTKLKLLSMALVGLGGLGLAGGAFAACPQTPTAWTSVTENSGSANVVSGGYDQTSCRLDATIDSGAGFLAGAFVSWQGTQVEPRYRAQFIVDAQNLGGLGFSDAVQIFTAASPSTGSAVTFRIYGAFGNVTLDYTVYLADGSVVGNTATLPTTGPVHVELELQTASSAGASDGYFKLWMENNDPNNASKENLNLSNYGMGVQSINLGLISPSPGFVANFGGVAVGFDQFDSRRQTFIGY